jgi:hypothetical protein
VTCGFFWRTFLPLRELKKNPTFWRFFAKNLLWVCKSAITVNQTGNQTGNQPRGIRQLLWTGESKLPLLLRLHLT